MHAGHRAPFACRMQHDMNSHASYVEPTNHAVGLSAASLQPAACARMHLQNINSWTAIADACSKSKSLQKLCFKDCAFTEGACEDRTSNDL